ncbi:hypothetical protein M434DRAFT_228741 [Hypoxylon sp. CO27-5]|nr:hypothetical protein M434DRAFT_228741 [Hypoxylon sp. CO27-5]
MAGPNVDSFQRALDRFKKSLSQDLVNQFTICNLQDVRNLCDSIQKEHAQAGKLRYMRRLQAFIEAMEQFGKVIEVFANSSKYVCFIWGPIKFVLGIARTYMDSFDKLLDVYAQLGEAIPGLLRYQDTFEKHPPLATVVEDYYSDILVFHEAALSVFKRPGWKKLFHSTWKTFDSKFQPIMQSLKKRRELLESEKGSATLYEIQKLRQDVSAMYAEQTERMTREDLEKHRDRATRINERLLAPNYQLDQELATEDRHGSNSGTWIFEDGNFRAWSNSETIGHRVLYVNGIPGAGKTTLMSVVIEDLLNNRRPGVNNHCVVYFYFKHKQPEKESHNSLLRAILEQLIDQDSSMSDHLSKETTGIEGTNLRSTRTLEKLVRTGLESYPISYIVLDGLDECARDEASKSVKWFLSLLNGGLDNTSATLRVLFCGQRDGTLDNLLAGQASISLESSGHIDDVRRYCQDICKKIQQKFDISSEMGEDIVSRVTNEAQGMFLYARLVLGNLLSQTKLSSLRKEMEPGTFPQGIEKAYERVTARIFEMSSLAERNDAAKILGWVIGARRLLRWREIQSIFCIDPTNGVVDYEEGRLRVTCKELCGSLVDVHHVAGKGAGPEDIIKIVHESAREYLLRKKLLSASEQEAKLAIFCSRYLTSHPFTCIVDEKDIITYTSKGYYAMQDYAVQYWFDHSKGCAELAGMLDPTLFQEVMESANEFFKSYGLASKLGGYNFTKGIEGVSRALKELPLDGRERNTYLNIELRTTLIRNKIEGLQEEHLDISAREIIRNLFGTTKIYKCSKPWCDFFTTGFEIVEDRNSHINRHDLPFYCTSEGCFAFRLGYDTQSKLDQHRKLHHLEPSDRLSEFPKVTNPKKAAAIWKAILQGDESSVKASLDSVQDVNRPNRLTKETLLYAAAKAGNFGICKLLLERGADVNLPSLHDRCTALQAAVFTGNLDLVHLLINQKECDPDQPDTSGVSPFCLACALGHLEIVKLLLQTEKIQSDQRPNFHPNCCKNWKPHHPTLIPLGYAVSEGHLTTVQYLLQHGQSSLVNGNILARAAQLGYSNMVDLLRSVASNPLTHYENDWCITFNPHHIVGIKLVHAIRIGVNFTCVRFSHDGKYFAAGRDATAQIFNVTTGHNTHSFYHNITNGLDQISIQSLCFSSDDKCLITGGLDGLIRIWDIEKRTIRHTFTVHEQSIFNLDISSDGSIIASGCADDTIRIWNIESGENTLRLRVGSRVTSVSISLDANYVAAASVDEIVRVWDIKKENLICSLGDHRGDFHPVALSPSGRQLLTGSDRTMRIWEPPNSGGIDGLGRPGSPQCINMFKTHEGSVRVVGFTNDNKCVISTDNDGRVQFWNRHTGSNLFTLKEHANSFLSVAHSPQDGYFATTSSDKSLRIWSHHQLG